MYSHNSTNKMLNVYNKIKISEKRSRDSSAAEQLPLAEGPGSNPGCGVIIITEVFNLLLFYCILSINISRILVPGGGGTNIPET